MLRRITSMSPQDLTNCGAQINHPQIDDDNNNLNNLPNMHTRTLLLCSCQKIKNKI